ncbi:hypothetical protein SCLARK_001471 [Spiroplasma clarkii]|uniref:Uncharacterized protein n=1 Tax=Spiroplasma clarkii TaxID=2139 RepID=A0A1Y0L2Q2_9MOLU|nr:hypothetical protein [Spiroplasma clarkii]ARU91988.1 hypothetical protein SCLARK_001471 [Spiroplasma clarkii]ATX71326.1 hypothetical protein SCLAR_v1c10260 [Spiroplasma clarkii]
MLKTKLLASLCFTSFAVPTAAAIPVGINYNEKIKAIYEEVKYNSQFLREGSTYEYNGKEYKSENEILKELLAQNPISEITTSSDPQKISLDYATGKIDGDRIYGTNQKDFTQVARNFYGKTILPNCMESDGVGGCIQSNKTAYERVLESYINPGLTRVKYSYDNSLFYDSTEEAKIAYKNTSFNQPQKALMYYYNGRYYNAFNKNDFERMKASMTKAYYYDASSLDNGNKKLNLNKSFAVSRENFADVYVNKLEADLNEIFSGKQVENIVENVNQSVYTIKIEIGEDMDYFTVNGKGSDIYTTNEGTIKISSATNGKSVNNRKDVLTIEISGNKLMKKFDPAAFYNDFTSYATWKKGIEQGKHWWWGDDDLFDWYQKTFTICGKSFTIKSATYEKWGEEYAKTNLKDSTFKKSELANNVQFRLNSSIPKSVGYVLNKYIYNAGKKLIDNFKDQLIFKSYIAMSYEVKLRLKDEIKKYLSDNPTAIFDSKVLVEDWIYSNSNISNFSVYTSKLIQEELLNEYKSIDPNEKFVLLDGYNISMTYDEWKNNFYLLDDTNNGSVNLQEKWFVSDTKTTLEDFSDLQGYNLSNTIEGAKQIQFDKQNPILYKKVFLYNPNGELIAEDYNENDAVNYLKSILNIKTSYVHKAEIKNIENSFTDFTDLISNGKYNVYTYKTNGQNLYFNSYENAILSYKNNINLIASVTTIYKKEFVYVYKDNNITKNFYWSNDQDLEQVVQEIYQLIY